MSGKLVPKLRVVRCPKCFLHLEESPEYDVYKCGGCGTTLQGKNKRSVHVNSKSSTRETNAATRNALKQHSNGLKVKATTCLSGESYVDGNVGRGENLYENGESSGDQLVPFNLSDEELESESDIYNLSHRRRRVSNKSSHKTTHCEIEEINDENDNNEKSGLVGENSEVENTASDLNDGNMLREGEKEELYSGLDGEDANNDKSTLVRENHQVEITGSNKAEEYKGKLMLEGAEEFNISAPDGEDPNKDQSTLVAAKSESASTIKSFSYENLASGKGSILSVTHTPGKLEEGRSGNPVSSDNKQQKKPQRSIHHRFNHLRSVDTSDTTQSTNHRSELSGTLGQLSNSPTTRSSHGYDVSLSSFDGKDEQFPIQHSDSSEKSRTFSNGVSEVRARKGTSLVNGMLCRDLGAQQQSYFPNGKHHVMKESREHQKKVLESPNHGHPHWMRTKRGGKLPPRMRMPFHQSGSHSRFEIGNSSNQLVHDERYSSSTFLSPDSYEDNDQEKMKLLRMIQKLQDQLNRTRYMSRETNGKPSTGGVSYKGKHYSAYHSHDGIHERRFSHGLDYPRCNGRCSQGVNWHQRHKLSSIPYSAEATISAHYGDHYCCHCFPQPQERNVLYKHEQLCRFCQCQGPDFYSSHLSYPSSPQCFTRETKSDDQRHRAPKLKRYVREKKNLGKGHCKPVAGGAPFVICHKCLKLLQLPAEFLLFKRAFHKLKCGGCSEVLKFSLQNGSHIVSFSPHAI